MDGDDSLRGTEQPRVVENDEDRDGWRRLVTRVEQTREWQRMTKIAMDGDDSTHHEDGTAESGRE